MPVLIWKSKIHTECRLKILWHVKQKTHKQLSKLFHIPNVYNTENDSHLLICCQLFRQWYKKLRIYFPFGLLVIPLLLDNFSLTPPREEMTLSPSDHQRRFEFPARELAKLSVLSILCSGKQRTVKMSTMNTPLKGR